jgi:hypothetical protein
VKKTGFEFGTIPVPVDSRVCDMPASMYTNELVQRWRHIVIVNCSTHSSLLLFGEYLTARETHTKEKHEMAKKKKGRSGFNMSAAVRDVLKENRKLSGKEVEAEVRKRNPGKKINTNSLNVSYSAARKKLGITKKKKRSVKKLRPGTKRASTTAKLDMATLQAARKYVSEVGDVEAALEAVRQLKTLQVR